jgi:hypothetical protein
MVLVINRRLEIIGFCAGNDVSSRSIEGENPLYLPQAKVYNGSCALGPVILMSEPASLRAPYRAGHRTGRHNLLRRPGQHSGYEARPGRSRRLHRTRTRLPTRRFPDDGHLHRPSVRLYPSARRQGAGQHQHPDSGERSGSLTCLPRHQRAARQANGPLFILFVEWPPSGTTLTYLGGRGLREPSDTADRRRHPG